MIGIAVLISSFMPMFIVYLPAPPYIPQCMWYDKTILTNTSSNWNIFIPGQRSENEVLSRRRPAPPKEHQKRVELVRKSIANSKK